MFTAMIEFGFLMSLKARVLKGCLRVLLLEGSGIAKVEGRGSLGPLKGMYLIKRFQMYHCMAYFYKFLYFKGMYIMHIYTFAGMSLVYYDRIKVSLYSEIQNTWKLKTVSGSH